MERRTTGVSQACEEILGKPAGKNVNADDRCSAKLISENVMPVLTSPHAAATWECSMVGSFMSAMPASRVATKEIRVTQIHNKIENRFFT
jgi:hypothetical protein